jgi:endonuclease YncB( thermonuclease family)
MSDLVPREHQCKARRYGRTLAICFEAREDLNAMMVLDGHAVA